MTHSLVGMFKASPLHKRLEVTEETWAWERYSSSVKSTAVDCPVPKSQPRKHTYK